MLELSEGKAGEKLIALVIALLEIVNEALAQAALRRVEGGRLSDAEIERLGNALAEIDEAIAQIKAEHGIEQTVQNVRHDIDQAVGRLIDTVVGRERWPQEAEYVHGQRV